MPIRVIPVVDLRSGRPVHARRGDRSTYGPLASVLGPADDPTALVRAFKDVLGLDEFYVADLDAIGGAPADSGFLRRARAAGLKSWVDAGLRDDRRVEGLLGAGASRLVAATETLDGPEALARVVARSPPGVVIFGLDLRDGRPNLAPGSSWASDRPESLVEEAVGAGARHILILDTARVGTARGVGTAAVAGAVVRRWPAVEVSVGGGVAGMVDLCELEDLGVSNALIGSALHDGTITAAGLRRPWGPSPAGRPGPRGPGPPSPA